MNINKKMKVKEVGRDTNYRNREDHKIHPIKILKSLR